MLNPPQVRGARPAHHPEHFVAVFEQQLSEVRTVLTGDSGNKRASGHLDRMIPSGRTNRRNSTALRFFPGSLNFESAHMAGCASGGGSAAGTDQVAFMGTC